VTAADEHLDVLIVGAGLSGIDAGYRLGHARPDRRWAILEARDAIGGTWDLFRYPGVRSDSDMTTLGFPFHPWRGEQAIADGADIRAYIRETARTFGIDRHIRFGHRVVAADWSSADARWTVTCEAGSAGSPAPFSISARAITTMIAAMPPIGRACRAMRVASSIPSTGPTTCRWRESASP